MMGSKIALVTILVLSSATVLALLIGTLWAVIVGNEWSELWTWGDDDDDK